MWLVRAVAGTLAVTMGGGRAWTLPGPQAVLRVQGKDQAPGRGHAAPPHPASPGVWEIMSTQSSL